MLETHIEIGPLTPQELDRACETLTKRGVQFEILKDEESEKSQMKTDYLNVVNKAEYRTETYLGQIFYLKLSRADGNAHKDFLHEFGLEVEAAKENPTELANADMSEVPEKAHAQKTVQKWIATGVVLVLVLILIWSAVE